MKCVTNFLIHAIKFEGKNMRKELFIFLLVLTLSGCGKKAVKPDPAVEEAMKMPLTCVKCRQTAPRISYGRINQVLVRCPGCQKVFPVQKAVRK